MSLASFALDNRITMYVLTALVSVGGIVAFQTMSALEDPEFTVKEAIIVTQYPGATAQEVAEEVSDRIDAAVQQLGQLDYVESTSQPGLSIVHVYIQDQYDKETLPQVWDELRRKVGDVQGSLPPGAGPSIVNDDFGDVYGVFLAVYGDGYSYRELKDYVEDLEKELVLVPDVSKVALFGVRHEVIYIEISRARLAQLGISESSIYRTLAERNLIQPAGRVEIGRELVRFVPTGDLHSVEEIGNTLVQGILSDRQLYLKDIATITRGYEEPPGASMHFDGRPAIGVGISTVSGGNVVTMGAALNERLDELIADTPIGIEIGEVYFQGNMVTAAVDGFVVSLLQAIAIVVGVLLLAMGVRSGLLIGGILLLTVLATFMVMKTQGIALERISLGALVIALGMLVDNAIVVVEGILVRAQQGVDRVTAAREVVKQTMLPLFGATLVAIMAFGALGLSQDSTGEYCRSLFSVITYSLLLSWLLAVTVTPLLCVKLLKVAPLPEGHDPYGGVFFRGYRAFLAGCIRARWLTVGVAVLLLALSMKGFAFVDQSFFPSSTTPAFTFDIWLPQGTDIRKTEKEIARLEEHALGLEQVESMSTYIGAGALRYLLTYTAEQFNTSYGQLIVQVESFEDIERTIKDLDDFVSREMPDALVFGKPYVLGPGGGSDIELRIRGKDPVVIRGLSEQVKAIMRADGASRDVRDDWREPVKVIHPRVLDSQASRLGLSRRDINDAMQRNFDGLPIGLYREGDTLIPIKSRAPAEERVDVDNARDMRIWSAVAGRAVPMRQVVSGFDTVWEDGNIERRDRLNTITPQCNAAIGSASVLRARIQPEIEALEMPPGYSMEWGGEYEDSADAQAALASNFGLTILVMVVIVIALFNSLRQPLIIWLTVPLALVGVTAGLLVSGEPFGFMALLGLLSLIGMMIKNAIVLLDEIDGQIESGRPRYTAVLDSCISRARPVSMAAVTTVLGMIPLLPDAFFASLAVTVMGGLSFATVLTLVVVPVLYCMFFRIRPSEAEEGSAATVPE